MRLLRATDHRRMPWKNGGGETTEIAVSPEAAGMTAFDWRISMATVAADGPFSRFPDVDRTLSILSGGGLRLEIQGMAPLMVTTASEPVSFPADAVTSAVLLQGPVVDLNVMTRRGRFTHRVTRRLLDAPTAWLPAGQVAVLFCDAGQLRIEAGSSILDLATGDALMAEAVLDGGWRLAPDVPASVYLIEILASVR